MKVRILNNAIRYRVSMDEMKSLASGKAIHSAIHFVSEELIFQVKVQQAEANIDLKQNRIKLYVNHEEVKELHESSEKVGFSFTQDGLTVLFEKDFRCLTDRGEDESRLYVNPRTSHS